MGTGIAYVFAFAGFATTVVEPNDARAETMTAELRAAADAGISRGRLRAETAASTLRRIARVASVDDLANGLSLIVETVPERLELKHQVLAAASAKEPLLLGTNTSSISIDRLATAVLAPERFVGMHFFNPVWSLPLVEIIRGTASSDIAITAAERVAGAIGKQSIVVADVAGFATSRLDLIASLEAMRMLEDGVASAVDIDRAAELAYRHPVGPLRLSDIVGLDVRLDISRQLETVYGERYRPPQILIDLVAAGHLGRKTGKGFHVWPDESH